MPQSPDIIETADNNAELQPVDSSHETGVSGASQAPEKDVESDQHHVESHGFEPIDEEREKEEEEEEEERDHQEQLAINPMPCEYEMLPESFDPTQFPSSYKENTSKELRALAYAENFRRQYTHLYRDRTRLFLNPKNECGVEKLVCSTIRPTKLRYPELYNWNGASVFVADYLNFVPLVPPTELPKRLLSPATVLKIQKGTCFEYSSLLCSLLLGVGYDAYVVSGYATRECCYMDETREICPLLLAPPEKPREETKTNMKKYMVRPPKDLRSKFELNQEARKLQAEQEAERIRKQHEEEDEKRLDNPSPDTLYGLRVHSWVLVLAGKREVPEPFFIEPLTGISHPLETDMYLGIESLWNDANYWVNMQDCAEGIKFLNYDLGDCTFWEYMFPTLDVAKKIPPNGDEDEEELGNLEKPVLDLPPSWTMPIVLSLTDFENRCPQGKKVKLYKKARLEKFSTYLLRDGLVARLTIYEDRELKEVKEIRENFYKRADKLLQRITNSVTGLVTEYFDNGRSNHLKQHNYQQAAAGPEATREMFFYNEARVDGLAKREETPLEIVEHYLNRPDFLYYRQSIFGRRVKRFAPATDEGSALRPIDKIVERFHRNPEIPANDDVAERVFHVAEDRIHLTYHTEDENIAASTREFIKPPQSDERRNVIQMHSDTHTTFQVDPRVKPKKNVAIYQLLIDLLSVEEKSKDSIRCSESETRFILDSRTQEEAACNLDIELFDVLRNEKARQTRIEMEKHAEDEKIRRQETELDYLAPFLAQINIIDRVTKEQALSLREDCLQDFKQRLIDKANIIQARFEQETEALQKKQHWYQQNQVSMSKEDEQEYLQYCNDATFRITTLESMLSRHKQAAPQKYMALERKLRHDPRLAEFLQNS